MCELSHYLLGMSDAHSLLGEMEAAAAELGVSVSTLGRLAGQGGKFHERLRNGRRVWPETIEKVRSTILRERELRAKPPEDAA